MGTCGRISFTVAPETDIARLWQQCKDLMAAHPKVLAEPASSVVITKISDGSVSLSVRCFARTSDQSGVLNDLYEQVRNLLLEEKISSQSTPRMIVGNY